MFVLDKRINKCYFVLMRRIKKETLKQIIIENKEFILNNPVPFI